MQRMKKIFSAPRCSDPGTPAEARQVVINYEDGQTLSYVCDRTGFEPEPDLTYTCQYNESTNSAVWTNDLANYQPVCKGMLHKIFYPRTKSEA